MKRIIAGAVIALGLVWLLVPSDIFQALMGRWTFVDKQSNQDQGYFYRVKVKLSHGDENLDFDYVVACNIRVTRWKDGGLSDDTRLTPERMYRATAAGNAVSVKTPALCGMPGRPQLLTETGYVPPDLLPLIIWFDDAKELSYGWGYVGEAAYESPYAKLKFGGANISAATREDWEKWREKSKAEYVQIGDLPGPWGEANFSEPVRLNRIVTVCHAMTGFKLPEKSAELLRPWMPHVATTYWHTRERMSHQERHILLDAISGQVQVTFPGGIGRYQFFAGDYANGSGVPVRSGRQVQSPPHVPTRWPPDFWPVITPPHSTSPPAVAGQKDYIYRALVSDQARKGFAWCDNFGWRQAALGEGWNGGAASATFMFDNEVIYHEPRIGDLEGTPIFRSSEYIYRYTKGF
jgi:hypothetical protein